MVDDFENNGEHYAQIFQCSYNNGQTGFIIQTGSIYGIYSCQGDVLCGGGGVTGADNSPELGFHITEQKLIYKN